MNWEIQVINSKEIIHFCNSLIGEKGSNSISVNSPQNLDSSQMPIELSIDTYISYMFIIGILLAFTYFKKQKATK